jgi:hypothetical protein
VNTFHIPAITTAAIANTHNRNRIPIPAIAVLSFMVTLPVFFGNWGGTILPQLECVNGLNAGHAGPPSSVRFLLTNGKVRYRMVPAFKGITGPQVRMYF